MTRSTGPSVTRKPIYKNIKQEVLQNERSEDFEGDIHSHDHRRRDRCGRRRARHSRHQRSGGAVGQYGGIGLLYASSIIVTVASVIQFIAGIKGVGACSDSQKAASCIKWGIIIAILAIISMIIGLVGGGTFSITSLVLNLLLPGLYVYGAMQVKNSITA